MFTPLGLDHVVFRVRDQQVAQQFYVDVLGCTVDHVNERISLIHLRFGEHYIDLLPATAMSRSTPDTRCNTSRRGMAVTLGNVATMRSCR